jgi:DNA-binding response OmpR family regulator
MVTFRILLVEDGPSWQKILRSKTQAALDQMGSPEPHIQVMDSFEAAYELLERETWDLLVTDIGLGNSLIAPQKLGIQLIELAKQAQTPAIAVSGTSHLTNQNVRDLLIESGAADFFTKLPFDGGKFIAKVQSLLQSQARPNQEIVNVRKQQLETRRTHLLAEWNTTAEKLTKLRQALIVETSAATKFQLETQIQTEMQAIVGLEQQLSEIEQILEHGAAAASA